MNFGILASERKASATHEKDFFGEKNGHIMSRGFLLVRNFAKKWKINKTGIIYQNIRIFLKKSPNFDIKIKIVIKFGLQFWFGTLGSIFSTSFFFLFLTGSKNLSPFKTKSLLGMLANNATSENWKKNYYWLCGIFFEIAIFRQIGSSM